jgi:WD40 repeat protein
VKVYDLPTLRLRHKYQWKVGPLNSVAYSPDGLLGAAASQEGKVVVWDVEG